MIDDDGQVALADAMADLVDPDALEAREQVDLPRRIGGNTLTDPADAEALPVSAFALSTLPMPPSWLLSRNRRCRCMVSPLVHPG